MENIDDIIKRLNLFYTDTLNRNDIACFDKIDKTKVNFKNSISLYDLIEKYNILYLAFKKEYSELKKLELGEITYILDFKKSNILNSRELLIYIDKPTLIGEKDTFLHLEDSNGKISSYITNGMNIYDKKQYIKVDLDEDIVKGYLHLFDKYEILLRLYYRFKNGAIFGDGSHTLTSKINGDHDNFLLGFDEFVVNMGLIDKDSSLLISICTNLGDDFGINVDKSKMELHGLDINYNEEDYEKILKNVYINGKYLNNQHEQVNSNEKISIKSLSKVYK